MKQILAVTILVYSSMVFAKSKPSSFTTDLSIGQDYILKSESAVRAKLEAESLKDYPSFPGLQKFLTGDFNTTPDTCVRLPSQFVILDHEFQPTGTGGGVLHLLYVDSVKCMWSFLKSKVYNVTVDFKLEGSPANITKIVPVN